MSRLDDDDDHSAGLCLPLPLFDLVWALLIAVMISSPEFNGQIQLPRLDPPVAAAAETAAATPASASLKLILQRDGQWSLDDQPLSNIAQVINQLQTPANAKRPIDLFVDVDDSGRGATQEMLQLQIELAKAQLSSRVRLKLQQKGKVPA